jgi:hypothetical protein
MNDEHLVVGPFHASMINKYLLSTGSDRIVEEGEAVPYSLWAQALITTLRLQ